MKEFPTEKYIDLENNPYLMGRITIHHVQKDFNAEVDIIHRESHKIFRHVDIVYGEMSAEEALIVGVQRLRKFLDTLAKKNEENPEEDDIIH